MEVQKQFGHFGDIIIGSYDSPGDPVIPFVVLRKAPLKYWDPEKDKDDKEDKSKADVCLAHINYEWLVIGWIDHRPERADLEYFSGLIWDKLREK